MNPCLSLYAARCAEPTKPAAGRSIAVVVVGLIVATLIAALGVRPDQEVPSPDTGPTASHTWIAEAFPTGQAGFAHAEHDR